MYSVLIKLNIMKKFFFLVLISLLTVTAVSCTRTSDVVQPATDTYSKVYDFTGNMVKSTTDNSIYGFYRQLPTQLLSSDVLLIYRQSGVSNGNPIWRLLPTTDFISQGELNYRFDFTKTDFQIFADADFDLSVQSNSFNATYLNNQTFRVVLVPAEFGNKNSQAANYQNYNDVITRYHIDDSNVKVYNK